MSETRGPLQAVGHGLAQVVVGIWVVVDAILSPIFRPFMRWLSGLRPVQSVERGIASLPPYAVLAMLAVPFAIEELLKVWAVVLFGQGHFVSGLTVYVGCHVFAILVCERIFSAGKEKLMQIPWFARLFTWLKGYKDQLVEWFKTTDTYKRMHALKDRLVAAMKRRFGKDRPSFGG